MRCSFVESNAVVSASLSCAAPSHHCHAMRPARTKSRENLQRICFAIRKSLGFNGSKLCLVISWEWRGKQEFAVYLDELVPLIFREDKHVAASPEVHVDAGSLERVRLVGAQHFDLQFVAEPYGRRRPAQPSWGCVSALDSEGQTIWIVDAHRDDVLTATEPLSAQSQSANGFAQQHS